MKNKFLGLEKNNIIAFLVGSLIIAGGFAAYSLIQKNIEANSCKNPTTALQINRCALKSFTKNLEGLEKMVQDFVENQTDDRMEEIDKKHSEVMLENRSFNSLSREDMKKLKDEGAKMLSVVRRYNNLIESKLPSYFRKWQIK